MSILKFFKGRSLIKSGLIYTIGSFLVNGINFLSFPVFSRLLSPSEYGITNLFSVWVGIFVVIGSLQLTSAVPVAKAKLTKKDFEEFLVTIVSFATMIFFIHLSLLFIIVY